VVACTSCHTNIPGGHHKSGTVGAKDCSACHVGLQVHASATALGAGFTCATCHQGSIHGFFDTPGRELCLSCHLGAERHASSLDCIDCHWPATHAARPDANKEGGFVRPPVVLPIEPSTTTTTATSTTTTTGGAGGETTTTTRPDLTYTGIALRGLPVLGLVLLGVGVVLWLREKRKLKA
jgi:hypothetical protein